MALRRWPGKQVALLLLLLELALSLFATAVSQPFASLLSGLSYLLPVLLFCLFFARPGEVGQGLWQGRAACLHTLPYLPLFLAAVLLVSTVTRAIMLACGLPPVGGHASAAAAWPVLLLDHALWPAVAEEALFRLVILLLLMREGKGAAVWQTALLFALFHGNIYQIPYAFVGGLFLGMAAQRGGALCAALMHLCNNLLSLLMQQMPHLAGAQGGLLLNLGLAGAIFLLAALSALFLWRRREGLPRPGGFLRDLFFSPLCLYLLLMLIYTCL